MKLQLRNLPEDEKTFLISIPKNTRLKQAFLD